MKRGMIRDLYAHMEWADARVWGEVLRTPAIGDDPFVRSSLFHLHVVQFAYLTGWTGGTPDPGRTDDFTSMPELRDWGRTYYPAVREWLAEVSDADLDRRDPVLWTDFVEGLIGRPPVRIPVSDMVIQVATHSTQHRAQVNRRIRELGGEPPFIDYVAWAWMEKPAADWGA